MHRRDQFNITGVFTLSFIYPVYVIQYEVKKTRGENLSVKTVAENPPNRRTGKTARNREKPWEKAFFMGFTV